MEDNYLSLFISRVENSTKVGPDGEYKGHCPFHDDSKASFSFNEMTGLFCCHAGCSEGNAYQFAEKIGLDPSPYSSNKKGNTKSSKNESHTDKELSKNDKKRARVYHEYLIENYDTLCKDLPWTLDAIKKTYTGYDIKTNRYTFLHLDPKGKIINIKWHSTHDSEPFSVKGHGSCRLYPQHLIGDYSKDTTLIVTEGEKDVNTSISKELNAVTSTTGASSIPKDLTLLKGFKKVVIVYDKDDPGQNGSAKLAKKLKQLYLKMRVFIHSWDSELPEKYDVTDFFNGGKTLEEFHDMLSNAEEYELEIDEDKRAVNYRWSDAGNAELLVHLYSGSIRYNFINKTWYVWNKQFWERDIKQKVKELAIKAARFRQKQSLEIEDPDDKDKLFQYGLRSESKVKVAFCLDMAKSMDPVATITSDWNDNPYLLQFTNGVLDLKTMNFETGKPEYMICQSTGYDYDPQATCPTWERAINEIMDGNTTLVSFIQRAFGYSLSGDTSEQCLFLLHGTGANGKGVVQDVSRLLLGNYAKDSPFSTFEFQYGKTQSNDLARLHSVRLVTSAESGETKRLNEEKLKTITGCDPITARFLYQEHFTYTPKFKLWLAVNSLPRVNDFSFGFWRRIMLIPFNVKFVGNDDDKYLREKLKLEIPGIMNWFTKGYQDWREHGLVPPDEVIQATKHYQTESDVVAEFIDSFIEYDDDARIKGGTLYKRFCDWWEEEYKGKVINPTTFGRRISLVTGIKSDKIGGFKYYLGMEFKGDDSDIPF